MGVIELPKLVVECQNIEARRLIDLLDLGRLFERVVEDLFRYKKYVDKKIYGHSNQYEKLYAEYTAEIDIYVGLLNVLQGKMIKCLQEIV
jgi:hypothetical protein